MPEREIILRGADSTAWLIVSVVATAAALALIALLLRTERQLVSRRVGTALLVLRMATLLAVFVVWLEPVASRTLQKQERRRLLVAVDLSESMEAADQHASPAEKLRWARSIGLIGNRDNRERLDRWIADYVAGREPAWVDRDETSDPVAAERLATARRDNLSGLLAEIEQMPRKEIARRLLLGTSGATEPLLKRLAASAEVELCFFAREARTERFESLPSTSWPTLPSFPVDASDLSTVLLTAERTADDAPLSGVVLVTDGRHNTGRNPLNVAERLAELSVSVYPVLVGSLEQPKDVAITALDYPRHLFEDDRPQVTVKLRSSGLEGEPLDIHLQQAGKTIQSQSVTLDGVEATATFELPPAEIGRHEYTVVADTIPGEIRDDNNQQELAIQVVDGKARVLLIDGEARWEFRFLANALSRDERVEMNTVVFHQPTLGVLEKTYFPSRLEWPADPSASPWADVDLVIVGDVAADDCPPELWERLERFASEEGGTVVLTAGKRHFPTMHRSEVLDRLLPVTQLSAVRAHVPAGEIAAADFGIRWWPTAEGLLHPLLQLDVEAGHNRLTWKALPAHPWGILGVAKPAATVLAHGSTAALPAEQTGDAEDRQAKRDKALLVHQNFGYGQVLWIGVDSTWRWRRRVGDAHHHRFWGQLARLAAENKSAARHPFVRFGLDRRQVETGEEVLLQAHWTRQVLQKFPDLKARVDVHREGVDQSDGKLMSVELNPAASRPELFEARIDSLPAGEYRLRLQVESATLDTEPLSARLTVREATPLERKDRHPNLPLLAQLAEAGDGRLFLPDELHELPSLFETPASQKTVTDELLLWDHWLVLVVLVGFLSTEWTIRKLAGLP